MEVLGPKGPVNRFGGADMLNWARHQLGVAYDIVDNPGGGLGFAIQTIGQVKTGLREQGGEAYAEIAAALDEAEEHAVHRHFEEARSVVQKVLRELPEA
ncbi:MAG: hypothetical protein ACREQM_11545 [Candidatus Dormibacteraceae bacterium]